MVPMRQRRSSRWAAIVPLAAAIVTFAAACSSTPASRSSDAATSGTPSHAGAKILDFTAPQLGGGTVEGADYAGKDTAIWFWAPW